MICVIWELQLRDRGQGFSASSCSLSPSLPDTHTSLPYITFSSHPVLLLGGRGVPVAHADENSTWDVWLPSSEQRIEKKKKM